MAEIVTLELPETLAQRAKEIAALTNRRLEDVLVELLFNPMLGINSKTLKLFATRYTGRPLGWVNIIHASDVLAYPIRASFNINLKDRIFLRDKFIASHNLWKKVAQPLGGLAGLSMAKGLESAHKSYWSRSRVARLVTANILGDHESIDSANPFRQWF